MLRTLASALVLLLLVTSPAAAYLVEVTTSVAVSDANDQHVGGWPNVPNVRTNCNWQERSATADIPKGAKTLYVQLAIFYATGTVDFDDVTIVPQK